jgi:hypothetical protein
MSFPRDHDDFVGPFNLAPLFELAISPIEDAGSDDGSDYEPEQEVKVKCDCHEILAKPIFEAPIELGECPICYDVMSMVDFAVTRCGHKFHTSCLVEAMEHKVDCPMCRVQLANIPDDDDDESEFFDEEEEGEEGEDDPATPVAPYNFEQFVAKLGRMGYSPLDALQAIYRHHIKSTNPKYTDEFTTGVERTIDDILMGKIEVVEPEEA